MTRIKIRVSAGVFEVSLIRVIEETSSVEVLWDRGVKREFKWGSVVFGSTDGPVQQRPSELAPDPNRECPILSELIRKTYNITAALNGLPVPTYSSVTAATATRRAQKMEHQSIASTSAATATQPYGSHTQYLYPARAAPYDYWQYQNPQYSQAYGYPGYYSTTAAVAGSMPPYNAYAYAQNQYHPAQLNWQQPYQGQHPTYYGGQQQGPQSTLSQPSGQTQTPPLPPPPPPSDQVQHQPPDVGTKGSPQPEPADEPQAAADAPSRASLSAQAQDVFKNLAALSSLQPAQITDILRDNPQLRDVVMAAVGEAQKTFVPS